MAKLGLRMVGLLYGGGTKGRKGPGVLDGLTHRAWSGRAHGLAHSMPRLNVELGILVADMIASIMVV